MKIQDAVVVITGAASAVGRAVSLELATRNVHGLALVDASRSLRQVSRSINQRVGDWICLDFRGDVTDAAFCKSVYAETSERCGKVNACVPISAPTCTSNKPQKVETDLMSPILWAQEMIAGIRDCRSRKASKEWHSSEPLQGMAVFVTPASTLSRRANRMGAAARSKINSATVSLMADADYHGVGCAAILSHSSLSPGWPGAGMLFENIFPSIRIHRQMAPKAIAEAICFIIANASGRGPSSLAR
jgi:NAD(P)-dependent dehydrogenase (short-subunit alcohol dehydrogenase family)